MSERVDPVGAYIVAALEVAGEPGWTVTKREGGAVYLSRGKEHMEWGHRFNSGDPKWFCTKAPRRFRNNNILPAPFRWKEAT